MFKAVIFTDEKYKGINPVLFGYEICKSSHSWGPGVRTYYLIHYVVSGYGYYRIGNREYHIGAGEMFVIPPYTEVYYEADKEKPWNYIWVGFTAEKLPVMLNDTHYCPEALKIFNEMRDCENLKSGVSAFLNARLWDLFALLLKNDDHQEDYIEKAIACIHSEYMKGITIEDIAKRLNLDRTYFSSLFKKKVSLSPKQYLVNYRMNIAASLLLDKGYSVTVTAHSVGYSDIFTFSKMFKRHFGISPNEYAQLTKTEP